MQAAGINYTVHTPEAQRPDRPPLVLIHGAGGNHLHWPPELRRLKSETVFALDLPGHAQSGPQSETSIAGYQERILAWMEALSIERAVMVGHSMGGAISIRSALEMPERVAGLVLVGTGGRLRVHPNILELSSSQDSLEEAVGLIMQWAFSPKASPKLVSLVQQRMAGTRAEVLNGDFRACDKFDAMKSLSVIDKPTLVICGMEDQLTPTKYSEFLTRGIPSARLELIEDAGHMVMLEKPDQVTASVSNFMQETFG